MNKNLWCTVSDGNQNCFQIFRNTTSPKQWYLQIDMLDVCRSIESTLTKNDMRHSNKNFIISNWIPGQIGISGNEQADIAAKSSTRKPECAGIILSDVLIMWLFWFTKVHVEFYKNWHLICLMSNKNSLKRKSSAPKGTLVQNWPYNVCWYRQKFYLKRVAAKILHWRQPPCKDEPRYCQWLLWNQHNQHLPKHLLKFS